MSQSPVILPGSPLAGGTMIGDINSSFAAAISQFSGTSQPTLGPGTAGALVTGQTWLNTSVTPNVLNVYDGTQFVPVGTLDAVAHTFTSNLAPLSWRSIIGDNGGFEVWQRGAGGTASFSVGASSTTYTADRWYLFTNANQASTVSQVAGIVTGSRYAAKVQRNNGQTGVAGMDFGFPLDSDECAVIAGQIVTVSFTAKAGANWSPTSGILDIFLEVGTGAPVKFTGGTYSSPTQPIGVGANLTTSPQRFVFSSAAVVPLTTTQAEVVFFWTPVGTAGADDSFTVDDVQLEVGTLGSAFERAPFGVSLLRCKRHFWKTFLYGTAPATNVGVNTGEFQETIGIAGANTLASNIVLRTPVTMRGTPAITTFNPRAANAQVARESGASSPADQSATATLNVTAESGTITSTGDAAGVVGNLVGVHLTADAGI